MIDPIVVMMTDEADAISEAFDAEMHEAKLRARKRGMDALYVRAHENALKFALIRACASIMPIHNEAGLAVIDESQLVIDADTMRWAVDLSRATVERMQRNSSDIADTQFQADMRALRKFIQKGGPRGLTPRDISPTSAGKHPKKMLDDLLAALSASGDVAWVAGIKTGTRRHDAYVHADYLHLHGHVADPEA